MFDSTIGSDQELSGCEEMVSRWKIWRGTPAHCRPRSAQLVPNVLPWALNWPELNSAAWSPCFKVFRAARCLLSSFQHR